METTDMHIDLEHPNLSTPASARAHLEAALRSDAFTQEKGTLRKIIRFAHGRVHVLGHCCLGVAAELCVRAGRAEWDVSTLDDKCYIKATDEDAESENDTLLPHDLAQLFLLDGIQGDYADVNDRGATFAEIADTLTSTGSIKELKQRFPACSPPSPSYLLTEHPFEP